MNNPEKENMIGDVIELCIEGIVGIFSIGFQIIGFIFNIIGAIIGGIFEFICGIFD